MYHTMGRVTKSGFLKYQYIYTFLCKFLQNNLNQELPTLRAGIESNLKLPAFNNNFKLAETKNMTKCGETMAERTGSFVY